MKTIAARRVTNALCNLFLLATAAVATASTHAVNDASLRGSAADGTCTQCLRYDCCPNGLKCTDDGKDGSCTTCKGQDETVCGDKCCKGGQECQGDPRYGYACTLPLIMAA